MNKPRHPEQMGATRLPELILAAKKAEAGVPFWSVLAITQG